MTVSKQTLIESAEKIVKQSKNYGIASNCSGVFCENCPASSINSDGSNCDYSRRNRKKWFENWLSENKSMTIEELFDETVKKTVELCSTKETNHTRLDKILYNIEFLEKQKKCIEYRVELSENQLICKKDDKLLCEYVASDALFNITTEGSRLENIHLVLDFVGSLLNVEEV